MARKKNTHWPVTVTIGMTSKKHFQTQRECADFLGIKGASKKALESRCRVLSFEIEIDERY